MKLEDLVDELMYSAYNDGNALLGEGISGPTTELENRIIREIQAINQAVDELEEILARLKTHIGMS